MIHPSPIAVHIKTEGHMKFYSKVITKEDLGLSIFFKPLSAIRGDYDGVHTFTCLCPCLLHNAAAPCSPLDFPPDSHNIAFTFHLSSQYFYPTLSY